MERMPVSPSSKYFWAFPIVSLVLVKKIFRKMGLLPRTGGQEVDPPVALNVPDKGRRTSIRNIVFLQRKREARKCPKYASLLTPSLQTFTFTLNTNVEFIRCNYAHE
jgi:hypothetical protein